MCPVYKLWLLCTRWNLCIRIAHTSTGLVVRRHQNSKFSLILVVAGTYPLYFKDVYTILIFFSLFWDRESGELSYPNTENMLANIGNVDVMPSMPDGYNFTLSDYLGTDICYQMQTDLQAGVCPFFSRFANSFMDLQLLRAFFNFLR